MNIVAKVMAQQAREVPRPDKKLFVVHLTLISYKTGEKYFGTCWLENSDKKKEITEFFGKWKKYKTEREEEIDSQVFPDMQGHYCAFLAKPNWEKKEFYFYFRSFLHEHQIAHLKEK